MWESQPDAGIGQDVLDVTMPAVDAAALKFVGRISREGQCVVIVVVEVVLVVERSEGRQLA